MSVGGGEGIIVTALRRPAEPAECVNGYAMDEIPLPRRMHTVTHTQFLPQPRSFTHGFRHRQTAKLISA